MAGLCIELRSLRHQEPTRPLKLIDLGRCEVTSGVEAGLTMPGMMIEIEADALISDELGAVFGK